jgi:hypothetical protein
MYHLVGQNPDGWDDDDLRFWHDQERRLMADKRSGPDDTDRESTAPYIGVTPDESETEHGSPLNFKRDWRDALSMSDAMIDDQIRQAYAMDPSGKDAVNKHARLRNGDRLKVRIY